MTERITQRRRCFTAEFRMRGRKTFDGAEKFRDSMVGASLISGLAFAEGLDFGVGQDSGGFFGGGEDAIHFGLVGGNFVAFEPEHHVGLAAHRADFDDLVEAEKMRWYAAV